MDKKGKKFTLKDFYLTVISTYVIIAVTAIFLWYFHYDITTILSFLGITISPSAPAFLAIFLSQYSEQANAVRKSEVLSDIQIRKEISNTREKHYGDVKKDLLDLESSIKRDLSIYEDEVGECRLDDLLLPELSLDKDMLEKYNRAFWHLSVELQKDGGDIVKDFIEAESTVSEVNGSVKRLGEKLKQILQGASKNYKDVILTEQTETPKHGASMAETTTVYSICKIWDEGETKTETVIKWIESLLRSKIPEIDVSEDSMVLHSTKVSYSNCILANTEGFSYGLMVLGIIRDTLSRSDLQKEFTSLLQKIGKINDTRHRLLLQIDKLVREIDHRRYNGVAACCPFQEYSGEIF